MPYDAGLLAAVCREINGMRGARCEKIYGIGRDETILILRGRGETKKLYINAGSSAPRLCFSNESFDTPDTPPNFCQMLRKHLNGAIFDGAVQFGSERAISLSFSSRDEMGFACERSIIIEIMNKYSNIILCGDGQKIIAATKVIDFSTSRLRQIIPGMKYELPPPQNKKDILDVTREELFRDAADALDLPADKFLIKNYTGFSPTLSREVAYRASGYTDAKLCDCDGAKLWGAFSYVQEVLRGEIDSEPTVIYDEEGKPFDFSFIDFLEYGDKYKKVRFDTPSEAICAYYEDRGRIERVSRQGHDILKLITNAKRRIEKKITLLKEELERAKEGVNYKRTGDIINSNLHMLKRGMTEAELIDYYDEECPTVKVVLNERLSPSDNAQHYYKLYNKCKTSEVMSAEQIKAAETELLYIESVEDAFLRASGETELAEIRRELSEAGYAKSIKAVSGKKQKKNAVSYVTYKTTNGYTVYCGKNNLSNDQLTMKMAEGSDFWFHVKGAAGSHAIMVCEPDEDPPEIDFTEAAMIAAVNSSQRDGVMVPVDYTRIKNIRKPTGSKPGFVTYKTNWTAYVTPDRERVDTLRQK